MDEGRTGGSDDARHGTIDGGPNTTSEGSVTERYRSRRGFLGTVGVAGIASLAGCSGSLLGEQPEGVRGATDYYVAPDGDDGAAGGEDDPLASVHEGLNRAQPGDTIRLRPGEYHEELRTVRSGEPGKPITITGPPEAVLRAREGAGMLLNIAHSHIHLRGITLNGLVDDERAFESLEAYATSLVRATAWTSHRVDSFEPVDYLEDVVIEPSRMGHAGAGMVSLTRVQDASIGGFEIVGPAGVHFHPKLDDPFESHVGEIIYAGTTVDDLDRYPWDSLDRTRDVRIHHIDNSAGYHHSQFADLKIGTTNVTVEYCTDRGAGSTTDGVEAAAIELKGNDCTARWNDIGDCRWGIIFGAFTPTDHADGEEWSRGHRVYGNRIHGVSEAAFKFYDVADLGPTTPEAQRILCGNRIESAGGEYGYATGDCGSVVPEGDGVGHTGGDPAG